MRISCGSSKTYVISNSGEVYSWGFRMGENKTNQYQPIPLQTLNSKNLVVADISCALNEICFVPDQKITEIYRTLINCTINSQFCKYDQLKYFILQIPDRFNVLQNRFQIFFFLYFIIIICPFFKIELIIGYLQNLLVTNFLFNFYDFYNIFFQPGIYPSISTDVGYFVFQPKEANLTHSLNLKKFKNCTHHESEVLTLKNHTDMKLKVKIIFPDSELFQSSHFELEVEPTEFELARVRNSSYFSNFLFILNFIFLA